jgi:hypothetical protein
MTEFLWQERKTPIEGESLVSFLNRWGLDNYCDGRRGLLLSIGVPTRLLLDDSDLKKLAVGLGVGLDVLRAMAPVSSPAVLMYRKSLIRTRYEAVCPECLVQEPTYSRQLWTHRLSTACPQHGRKLLDVCTACGSLFEQDRLSRAHCAQCGADLRKQKTLGATDIELAFNARLCGGDGYFPLVQGRTPQDFDLFVLGLATYLCDRSDNEARSYGPIYAPRTVGKVRQLLEPFFALLEDWPKRLDARICDLVARNQELTAGPARAGRLWYRHIFRKHTDPAYAPTRQAAANAMMRGFGGSIDARMSGLLAAATIPKEHYSVSEVAHELGVSVTRIQSGIESGLIKAAVQIDAAPHYRQRFVARAEIERLKEIRASYIDHASARKLLGVSRKQYPLLLEAGWVTMADESVPPVVDGPVLGASVKELLQRLHSLISAGKSDDVIAFDQLNLRRTTDRQRLVKLLSDVLSGRVLPVGCDGRSGVAGLLFEQGDISRRVESRYASRALTLQQVSILLNVHEDAVRHWADTGVLASERLQAAQGSPRVVQLEDLVGFLLQYTPLSVQAAHAQTSSRALARRMQLAGVSLTCESAPRGTLVRLVDLARAVTKTETAVQEG